MSFLWGGKGGGKKEFSSSGDLLGGEGAVADPYANIGSVDTAKVTDADDGVQDLVGGMAVSGGAGAVAGGDPYGDLSGVDLGGLAPMFGQSGGPEYLEGFNKDGRDIFQRMIYNMGHAYLGGIALGGAYGAVEGLGTRPAISLRSASIAFERAGSAGREPAMPSRSSQCSSRHRNRFSKFRDREICRRGTSDVAYPVLAGLSLDFCTRRPQRGRRIMALYTVWEAAHRMYCRGDRLLGESIFL